MFARTVGSSTFFAAVARHQVVVTGSQPAAIEKLGACQAVEVVSTVKVVGVQDVYDQVLDDNDISWVKAFSYTLLLVLIEVGVNYVSEMVYRRPVFLFWHPPVV